MFKDFTSVLAPGVVYFKDAAEYGKSNLPVPSFPGFPKKTWGGLYAQKTYEDNGLTKDGFLVFAKKDGKYDSVKVVSQGQRIDHIVTTVDIIPFSAGRYFHPNQHRFYVEYKDHPMFKDGFPFLTSASYSSDSSFLSFLNFSDSQTVFDPPVYLPPTKAVMFKPGSDRKEIQVFEIEEFIKAYPRPTGTTADTKTYLHSNETLAQLAAVTLMDFNLSQAQKGEKIRSLALE